ncbi:G Protein-Regulated Inducer Of Neurite Outgrowth 1 [Manis pentadactyla]|nr:G Protein-Regulated Inducer Of Neurite Outgrowth 1 [Manis pentadactyla]
MGASSSIETALVTVRGLADPLLVGTQKAVGIVRATWWVVDWTWLGKVPAFIEERAHQAAVARSDLELKAITELLPLAERGQVGPGSPKMMDHICNDFIELLKVVEVAPQQGSLWWLVTSGDLKDGDVTAESWVQPSCPDV